MLCVAPAWNEEKRIAAVVKAMPPEVDTCLVVDDGSTDTTGEVARAAGAEVLRNEKNTGVGASIRSGIERAIEGGYDIVAVVSGGGKTPPAQIPRLLAPIALGKADFTQGSRYLDGGEFRNMPWSRRWGTRGYSFLFSLFLGSRITDASSGFRAVRTSLFKDERIKLRQEWLDRYELEPYLLFQAVRRGHRVIEVPVTIEYPTNTKKYTKMRPLLDWWKIFRPVVFLRLGLKD